MYLILAGLVAVLAWTWLQLRLARANANHFIDLNERLRLENAKLMYDRKPLEVDRPDGALAFALHSLICAADDPLRCPCCESYGVTVVAGEMHCNQCGLVVAHDLDLEVNKARELLRLIGAPGYGSPIIQGTTNERSEKPVDGRAGVSGETVGPDPRGHRRINAE